MSGEAGKAADLRAQAIEQARTALDIARLLATVLRRVFTRPWRFREITAAIAQIGVDSLPIIVLSTAFAGLVITREIAYHMDRVLHTVQMIPGFTGQFIIRELGIAIPAMLLVSKVGASTTAEVGTMKVTEQIDALKLLRIDPVDYLVVPRFVASIAALACLTLVAIAVTLACAIAVAVGRYGFNTLEYLNAFRHFVDLKDVAGAVVKGMAFGAVIPIVSCAYGFRCRGGAEGVGTATTNSVVAATVVIIVLDFLLTYLFTSVL
jgi:phospholipid/cholesterol/gamma-HCH transport system permease protein